MKRTFFLVVCLLLVIWSQEQGIKFDHGLSWQQILAKAKAEKKFIFLDCYATWCGPCKEMDKKVYPNDSVGNYMNEKFICVKMQMDTSKQDDEEIINEYSDAYMIKQSYKISALPSYLFFSADGKILHRAMGYYSPSAFITLARGATDPGKQYYTLLERYQTGKKDYFIMPYLAKIAKSLNEDELSLKIATDYMHQYLDGLPDSLFYSKKNLTFINSFYKMIRQDDRVFKAYFFHHEQIDSIFGTKGYSQRLVNHIIYNIEISPVIEEALQKNYTPEWRKLKRKINNRYGNLYGEVNILQAKIWWYRNEKDWKNYSKYLVRQVEKDPLPNPGTSIMAVLYLNNSAWDVFNYSNNKRELKKALTWVERALLMTPTPPTDVIDTKANLLYKLGNRKDGIAFEEKAIELSPKNEDMRSKFNKMKNGAPTWILQ